MDGVRDYADTFYDKVIFCFFKKIDINKLDRIELSYHNYQLNISHKIKYL